MGLAIAQPSKHTAVSYPRWPCKRLDEKPRQTPCLSRLFRWLRHAGPPCTEQQSIRVFVQSPHLFGPKHGQQLDQLHD